MIYQSKIGGASSFLQSKRILLLNYTHHMMMSLSELYKTILIDIFCARSDSQLKWLGNIIMLRKKHHITSQTQANASILIVSDFPYSIEFRSVLWNYVTPC